MALTTLLVSLEVGLLPDLMRMISSYLHPDHADMFINRKSCHSTFRYLLRSFSIAQKHWLLQEMLGKLNNPVPLFRQYTPREFHCSVTDKMQGALKRLHTSTTPSGVLKRTQSVSRALADALLVFVWELILSNTEWFIGKDERRQNIMDRFVVHFDIWQMYGSRTSRDVWHDEPDQLQRGGHWGIPPDSPHRRSSRGSAH
jgi:hypothetical protein